MQHRDKMIERVSVQWPLLVVLALLMLLIVQSAAWGDRCASAGGCVGQVAYMHIPRGQRDSAKIFTQAGLPKVHDHAVLRNGGYALSEDFLTDPRLPGDLAKAVEKDTQLPLGMELGNGAEVLILGYRVFPELKELFARVLIVSDGSLL